MIVPTNDLNTFCAIVSANGNGAKSKIERGFRCIRTISIREAYKKQPLPSLQSPPMKKNELGKMEDRVATSWGFVHVVKFSSAIIRRRGLPLDVECPFSCSLC